MPNNRSDGPPLAVITGGSMGLGFTLARFLAAQGYDLVITARGEEHLQKAQEQLESFGVAVIAPPGDVSDPDHRQLLADIVTVKGGLDILVNNASTLGQLPMPSLLNYQASELRQTFETNTLAPLALVQLLEKPLIRRQGLVVNISSDAALGGYESWGGYGATKAALDLISLTLANELREIGISVISVDPGDMQTEMQGQADPFGADISNLPPPEATVPFWAWLFGQDPALLSGKRFQAQAQLWQAES